MKTLRHILALALCLSVSATGFAVRPRTTSGQAVGADRDNPALWQPASHPMLTKAAQPGTYATYDFVRTGSHRYPVALVEFSDVRFIIKDKDRLTERFDRMFNQHGFTHDAPPVYTSPTGNTTIHISPWAGCVRDYFYDQSFGKFDPQFDIIGTFRLPRESSHYGKGNENSRPLMRELLDSIAGRGIDLTPYIRNGNIDGFLFIYAGKGENYSGANTNSIYPKADTIKNRHGINNIRFACSCELFWDSDTIIDGIGAICHEFSHLLGLPDFYNVFSQYNSTQVEAMGLWSLMDYGNYANEGFTPSAFTAFEKYSMGWMDLEDIDVPGYYTLTDVTKEPDPAADIHTAYRINTTGNDDTFIILENHLRTGWNKFNPAEGLMATAVAYLQGNWTSNLVNTSYSIDSKRYHILAADNNYSIDTERADLFPYNNIDSITINGAPRLAALGNNAIYSIYNIRWNDASISFYAGKERESEVERHQAGGVSMSVQGDCLIICAPAGSQVSIHELSGRTVLETVMETETLSVPVTGSGGFRIVRCAGITRKLRIEN